MEQTIKKNDIELEPGIDPTELEYLNRKIKDNHNLLLGVIAGFIAALIGAGIWAGITIATDYQIGWMAVGVGFLVGYAVRYFGKGIDNIFGIMGATLSLFGCALGNLLTMCIILANQENLQLLEVISILNVEVIFSLMKETFHAMDLLFYGIAIYEGYTLSFRQYTEQEVANMKQYA